MYLPDSPTFIHTINVAEGESARYDDCFERFIKADGYSLVQRHRQRVEEWATQCEQIIRKAILKGRLVARYSNEKLWANRYLFRVMQNGKMVGQFAREYAEIVEKHTALMDSIISVVYDSRDEDYTVTRTDAIEHVKSPLPMYVRRWVIAHKDTRKVEPYIVSWTKQE